MLALISLPFFAWGFNCFQNRQITNWKGGLGKTERIHENQFETRFVSPSSASIMEGLRCWPLREHKHKHKL